MRKLKSKQVINILMIALIFVLSAFMELYFLLIENKISINDLLSKDIFSALINNVNLLRMLIIISFFIMVIIAVNIYGYKKIGEFLYNYRYPVAGIIFVLLIVLEIHGSSISYWQYYFKGSSVYDTIIGIPRGIRSDEWAVNTPMMLSQYFNSSGTFPYFSETIRGALTDVFIVYGQPVRDIAVLFRPFQWGYLFLSPAKGLSFFWMGRTICLFLVSFEFGMLISKKSKVLSLTYAILITWAPIVQWWFAINGLVEMLIFGQLALIMTAFYMKGRNYFWRSFYAFIILICAGGYILIFYPAWQVPLGYVFLALLISTVHDNWKDFSWGKKDILILVALIVLLVLGMSYVLFKSLNTVLSVLGTVYPGSRLETGGNQLSRFFLYPGNLFFAFSRELPYANTCELAVFFDFFPMGVLLSVWVLLLGKKKDVYLLSMMIASFILTLWCLFQWPEWLANITLLSYTQAARAFLAVGLLNILLLIRALSLIKLSFKKWISVMGAALFGTMMMVLSINVYEGYIDIKMAVSIMPIMIGSFYVIFNGNKDWAKNVLLVIVVCIAFISGIFINPLSRGLDVIYKQDIIKEIQQINESDSGLWIVDSGENIGFPIINIPLMAGAPTINSTNVYPILDRWQLLDPDKSSEDVYNRYAQISINLVDADTESSFELTYPDQFTVKLSVEDLHLLGLKYVLSTRTLNELSTDNINFKELSRANGFTIYEVEYN